jgi:hypothetical protein
MNSGQLETLEQHHIGKEDANRHDSSQQPHVSCWRTSHVHSPLHSMRKSDPQFIPSPVKGQPDPEYAPAKASHASEFKQLVKQGHLKETLRQEGQRTSYSFRGVSFRQKGKLIESLAFPKLWQATTTDIQQAMALEQPSEQNEEDRQIGETSKTVGWGEDKHAIILHGDGVQLKALEMQMGKHSVRQRTNATIDILEDHLNETVPILCHSSTYKTSFSTILYNQLKKSKKSSHSPSLWFSVLPHFQYPLCLHFHCLHVH